MSVHELARIRAAVPPEHRQLVTLFFAIAGVRDASHRKGFQMSEASWILENNDKVNRSLDLLGTEIYKTYRIYQKTL